MSDQFRERREKQFDSTETQEGKEVTYLPWEKRPLLIPENQKRTIKKYQSIFEFQDDFPTKEEKEKVLDSMRCFEIDELIHLAPNVQAKIYYSSHKRRELIFRYEKHPVFYFYNAPDYVPLSVYNGPDGSRCAEYTDDDGQVVSVRLSWDMIQKIQAAMTDNLLFETEDLEHPYEKFIMDGYEYTFYVSVLGRENTLSGSNIRYCRKDYEHCIHAAHMIDTLEQIREILVHAGVPEKYFEI